MLAASYDLYSSVGTKRNTLNETSREINNLSILHLAKIALIYIVRHNSMYVKVQFVL